MATSVEEEILRAVEGERDRLEGEEDEEPLCDFSLEDQAALAEAQGVSPGRDAIRRPKLGESLTLVVANVALREDGSLLMVQEAKSACAGKWYLPAGRVDRGETLVDAAARELKEETGLDGGPETLLAVETAAGSWFRFTFASRTTGGELKTPANADAESLQAKWVRRLGEVSLRADDFAPLVERGRARLGGDPHWHANLLPARRPHSRNLLRLVAVIKRRSTNRAHVLLGEKTRLHLPAAEINPTKSVHSTLRRFLVDIFGSDLPQHRPHGLLAVEHSPGGEAGAATDGVRLTALVAFRPPLEEAPIIGKYVWHELPEELGERLLAKVASKNATVLFHVVR